MDEEALAGRQALGVAVKREVMTFGWCMVVPNHPYFPGFLGVL